MRVGMDDGSPYGRIMPFSMLSRSLLRPYVVSFYDISLKISLFYHGLLY